ncbi:MAG: UDP-3-O-(3-hydroxymyristoyl)glucosamine N-acyltransferase [Planctomycetota bacterium]|jgi:UDP-3-O-[3-hydroxymyristoyl] glucosamine N-acyltransferase
MSIQASTLFEEFRPSGLLQEMAGDDAVIERVSAADQCSSKDLVFVDREAFVKPVLESGAAAVITDPGLAPAFAGAPRMAVMTAPNVKLARALVTQRFFDRDLRPEGTSRIDPSAVIADSAEVADSARIGANVCLGPEASVGEDTVILANAVVEERAVIGDRTVIHPGVVVGFECEVGSDVIIRAGTIIGSEGFGFAQDAKRRSHRIPQMGKVVIGDRVVIGANCCLDRGTHGVTRIGTGTVMDNLCHIAHNVEVGENCILTAMLCVAGSTKIGNRVMTSGQVGIIDHRTIADDVALVHRAGVVNDVKTPGPYAGVPLMPLKDHLKSQASIRRLARMRDTIKQLEERIAALESGSD